MKAGYSTEALASSNLKYDAKRGAVVVDDATKPVHIPAGQVWDVLDLSNCQTRPQLPLGLTAYELYLRGSNVVTLPAGLQVTSILDLTGGRDLLSLPEGIRVGTLRLGGCVSLQELPEQFDVWFLSMSGCWGFKRWPKHATIRNGDLDLRGCTAMTELPTFLETLGSLNVRDCSNLQHVPDQLRISGWIDIAQSGLAQLKESPHSLRGVEVRWQGVRIPERLWFRPESIQLDEILQESNAELRRVLIDRFGQSRFMTEAKSEVLDTDTDSGGVRQLIRVPLPGDEPLVTLSCQCPSTKRQYFLRVPPNMKTCRQAAAWMAGYNNPDDYAPLIET